MINDMFSARLLRKPSVYHQSVKLQSDAGRKSQNIFQMRNCGAAIPSGDEFVIMPNHLHGIIVICECDNHGRGEVTSPLHKQTLGKIVAYFKYQSTKLINKMQGTPGKRFWQRNYYDRIIRDEKELNNIQDYILNNPIKWWCDEENPKK